jgi:hypothetical protein
MQRPSLSDTIQNAARRGLCCFFLFCIALVVVAAPALHAQSARDDLPPLPDATLRSHAREAAAGKSPSLVDEFQLLVPPPPLICWSHSALENPQGDHHNEENSDVVTDSPLPREATIDPVLGSVAPLRRDP